MEDTAKTPAISPETARAVEEYLVNTGIDLGIAQSLPMVVEINGHSYVYLDDSLELVKPVLPEDPPAPDTFSTFSLGGLVDFIKSDVDGLFNNPEIRHLVTVRDARLVTVYSPLTINEKRRVAVAKCAPEIPQIPFGRYLDPEEFQIMVQTRVLPSENRDLVLRLAGAIKSEQSMQTADDGFSQKVTVKRGVATVGDVVVKNPVHLSPIRTFYEVEQPASPFVLRFDEQAQVALFEVDGGAWKLQAVQNIKEWLLAALEGCNVEVIA